MMRKMYTVRVDQGGDRNKRVHVFSWFVMAIAFHIVASRGRDHINRSRGHPLPPTGVDLN